MKGLLRDIDGASLMSFEIRQATLFAGIGGSFNDDRDTIVTDGAIGFYLEDFTFAMAIVSKGTTSFTGLQATLTNASLQGIPGLVVSISGTLLFNSTRVPSSAGPESTITNVPGAMVSVSPPGIVRSPVT